MMQKKFKNYLGFRGSNFKNDEDNNAYILKTLNTIVRSTECERILVASSLNKKIETALYDLFNKFYIKRGGEEYYKVGLESGALFTEVIHPKFNCAIILHLNEIGKID